MDTVRIANVKGHASAGIFAQGEVRSADREGNEQADYGARTQSASICDRL